MIWKELIQHAREWLAEYSWRAFAALAILVLGSLLAAGIRRLLRIFLHARAFPARRTFFIPQIGWLVVMLLTATLVLAALGLAGPVIGFIVTVGVALGLLADSFSGLRILATQPFRIGDRIEIKGEGVIGDVVETSISDIILLTADNTKIIVPNRKLLGSLVVNHSSFVQKPSTFQFVLDPILGIKVLEEQISKIIDTVPEIRSVNEKQVFVTAIEANAVTFQVRIATSPYEAGRIASEFLKAAKTQFDQEGVGIRSLKLL